MPSRPGVSVISLRPAGLLVDFDMIAVNREQNLGSPFKDEGNGFPVKTHQFDPIVQITLSTKL